MSQSRSSNTPGAATFYLQCSRKQYESGTSRRLSPVQRKVSKRQRKRKTTSLSSCVNDLSSRRLKIKLNGSSSRDKGHLTLSSYRKSVPEASWLIKSQTNINGVWIGHCLLGKYQRRKVSISGLLRLWEDTSSRWQTKNLVGLWPLTECKLRTPNHKPKPDKQEFSAKDKQSKRQWAVLRPTVWFRPWWVAISATEKKRWSSFWVTLLSYELTKITSRSHMSLIGFLGSF